MRKILIGFISVLFCFSQALAQKYTFISYSTEQGLPQSQVSSMVQDSMGYLWVGTLGGLARFNGEDFVTFSTKDGLVNNRITHLEIIENELWVGHDGGVSVYQHGGFKKYLFEGEDKSRNVSDIVKFGKKTYICSNGGGLFVIEGNELRSIDLLNPDHLRIRQALVEGDKLLLATRDGILVSTDGKKFEFDSRFERLSYSGITHYKEQILLTTYTDGFFRYNAFNNELGHTPYESFGRSLYGAYVDKTGKVWFATQQGMIFMENGKAPIVIDASNGLPVEMISCYFQDKDGTIWFGSQGKGFFRFAGKLFVYYDRENGWLSDLFLCGFQKQNGEILLGSFDNGVIKRSAAGNMSKLDIDETTIWSTVSGVDEKDWFGAQSGLIGVDARGKITQFTDADGLPGNKIAALYKIDASNMLIGGNDGAALYSGGKLQKYNVREDDFIGTVRDFCIIKDSVYCVSNLGLFVLRDKKFQPLLNDRVVGYNVESDQYNAVWFGTEEGLYRMGKDGIDKILLLEDVGSNMINFLNYRSGKMYVGTNNGLYILSDLSSKAPTFVRYGISEGIVDLETNLNSSFFDLKGNFWFGTAKGLIKFNVNQEKENISSPFIRLSNLMINYSDTNYHAYTESFDLFNLPKQLTLPYNKNNLIFEFDAVSLGNRRGMRFQYFLQGLSEEWSPLSEVSTITFTSVPAGDYVLLVRAVDVDGNLSNTLSIPLTINPAFYKTWWFIALMIVIIFLIVLLFFRMRIRRLRDINEKEKLQYKTRLLDLEQKSVNASMNRHFIFNALNSIQYFINTQDKRSANRYLTNFAQLIRKNLDSANADQNMITLEEELDRIKLYLSLEEMRFMGKFVSEITVHDVDVESVMIPAMILQPFVENAIIHGILPLDSTDGKIAIDVSRVDGHVEIRIEDNGIGIQRSLMSKVDMDGDHRSQGMEISAKRVEILRAITKQDISLEGPSEMKNPDGSIKGTYVLLKIPDTIL